MDPNRLLLRNIRIALGGVVLASVLVLGTAGYAQARQAQAGDDIEDTSETRPATKEEFDAAMSKPDPCVGSDSPHLDVSVPSLGAPTTWMCRADLMSGQHAFAIEFDDDRTIYVGDLRLIEHDFLDGELDGVEISKAGDSTVVLPNDRASSSSGEVKIRDLVTKIHEDVTK